MKTTWSLDVLYQGFDDPKFTADLNRLKTLLAGYAGLVQRLPQMDETDALVELLRCQEEIVMVVTNVGSYASLRQSADTRDAQSASMEEKVCDLMSEMDGPDAVARQYIAGLTDLEDRIASHPLLKEYAYRLRNIQKDSKYLLSEPEEALFSKMNLSGAAAWENLQANLTSSLPVSYRGQTITLSKVRNLAYEADPQVRKDAYEAELAAYARIEDAVAFSLNSIKLQVINECKLRGFASPLDQALHQSRMKRETLDAMWAAIEGYLPKFWQYLRVKAKALGHENGLPWYDLFAPMGKNDKKYTVEEAREEILRLFGSFDEDLRAMGQRAFDEAWIDFFPREGKVGGAFDCGLPFSGQSRVLTNFAGGYSDLVTLAHELGHAFHDRNTFDHRPLNLGYSMPVAETASTFNENIVNHAALANASTKEEELAILESMLKDATQIICDIYSRYLFETAVFARREEEFLPANTLCQMMLEAQKKAYGDGLDPDVLHPYMWLCKSHYYSGSLSFYNFPYAFGGLFARGLYVRYQAQGKAFVETYKQLLHSTTVCDVEDVAKIAGIDLTDPGFWQESLRSLAKDIDRYIELVEI